MSADLVSEAVVIGGGLAGSSLAIALAAQGRAVTLLEKSKAAHPKVCGEFLSHEALHYLALAGLDATALMALGAVPIKEVRLAAHRLFASATVPFAALSLSRQWLDESLLRAAAEAGVQVRRGERAQAILREKAGWRVTTANGLSCLAGAGFLATGKHDAPGLPRPVGKHSGLIAFKMYFRLTPTQHAALGHCVELVLYPGGYTGLQPIEGNAVNLCLLIEKSMYHRLGGSWPALLAHVQQHAAHLATRLAGAEALLDRPLSLSSIPYGYVRSYTRDELWRLGDQAAVIPSFAGDGMSIALHSARLAARMYTQGSSAGAYQQRLAHEVTRQVSLATLLSRGLVHMPRVLTKAARAWPGVLAVIARSTRIRERSLLD